MTTFMSAVRLGFVPVCVIFMACVAACSGETPQTGKTSAAPADTRTYGTVDEARLRGVGSEPDQWLAVGRDGQGTYYSPLEDINATNVTKLGFAWEHTLGTNRGLEATPIVVDGVMYAVGNWGRLYALDAATGAELWTYDPQVDGRYWGRYACCDVVNRGIVVAHGTVYVGSIDGYLHAVDARNGARRWKVDTLSERGPNAFHYFITSAPVLAGGLIVIGNGGSDFTGARGSISAWDASTGSFKWRFFTVPRDPKAGEQDQPHLRDALRTWPSDYDWRDGGGGSAWDALSYDPELQLIYLGTAHASPYKIHAQEKGGSDQLYTASIVAVRATDGQFAWSYQATPGDGWDYDSTAKFVLADLQINGRQRKTLLQANKNGFFYVLDRTTGEVISARQFAYQNWATGLDPKTHRPRMNPAANWHESPKLVFPAAVGAHGWQPMSYSAKTGLVYIPVIDAAMVYVDTSKRRAGLIEGNFQLAFFFPEDYDPKALNGMFGPLPALNDLAKNANQPPRSRGLLRAFDPLTGRVVWEQPSHSIWDGGVLSTAGNLVFRGDAAGVLNVYAAESGKLLKQLDVGTSIMAAPMTYRVNGVQYVSVMAGYGGGVLFAPFPKDSAAYKYGNAGRILTFRLDGTAVPKPAPFVEPPIPEPPAQEGTAEQIARGEVLYTRYCSRCHAFGRGLLPDLRRLTPTTHKLFYEIVLNGAYEAKGMARWNDVLSRADAEAIHSFIVDQASQARSSTKSEDAALLERKHSWEENFNKGDAASVAALYAPDARLLMTGAPPTIGAVKIQRTVQDMIKSGVKVRIGADGHALAPDIAYVHGRYSVQSGDKEVEKGDYVEVWRKFDGVWKIVLDMNVADSSTPPQ